MASEQFVVFRLGGEEYAASIDQVKEIISYGGATKLPGTPSYLEGIINLRGKVIPVVDLAKKFGLVRADEDAQAIIVEAAGREVGMMVDYVSEVLRLEDTAVEPPGTLHAGEFIRGIGKLEGRLLILLDLDKVFSDEEQDEMKAAV